MGEAGLGAESDDVGRTLDYGRGKVMLKLFGFDLLCIGLGVALLLITNSDRFGHGSLERGWHDLLGVAALLFGLALFSVHIRQTASVEPLLRLSPAGARLNMDGAVFVDVPWSEVSEVAALDVEARFAVRTTPFERSFRRPIDGGLFSKWAITHYDGVTALHVSQAFYDKEIAPRRKEIKRGGLNSGAGMARQIRSPGGGQLTGLDNIFVRRGNERYVLLHHAILPVGRDKLRAAVEQRWRAFHGMAQAAARQ